MSAGDLIIVILAVATLAFAFATDWDFWRGEE